MIRVGAVILLFHAHALASSGCDSSSKQVAAEGNVGETAVFPWLGVLRVHLHQGDVFKVALTGLVLVKERFALANADDVARIPKRIFKEDSKAMFIPTDDKAWFCPLLDYMTHPEYEFSTMNTIAIVELDPGEDRHFPASMKPICWPPYKYNTSNELYAIGFTDDNQLLEKSVFSLQYVELKLCEEFYNRAGLVEGKLTPTHYLCGFAKHNQENCVWDNGIVMASNTTGQWKLIGFGIRGPGCAAPARFISMQPFFPWIESATNMHGDELDYRKSAFNEGFRRSSDNSSEELTPDYHDMIQHKYLLDSETVQNEYFSIDRIDPLTVNIRNVQIPAGQYCELEGTQLVYRDALKVVARGEASVSYRLSLYDLNFLNYTCVQISLKSISCPNASIYYEERIDNKEGTAFRDFGETPEHLLITVPIQSYHPKPKMPTTTPVSAWKPGPHLKAEFIKEDAAYINIRNYNIYFTFRFKNEGIIDLRVHGPPAPPVKKKKEPVSSTTEDIYDLKVPKGRQGEVEYDEYYDTSDAEFNGTDARGNGTGTQDNGTDTRSNGTDTRSNGTVTRSNGTDTQSNGTVDWNNGTVTRSNGADAGDNETMSTPIIKIPSFEPPRIDKQSTSFLQIERPLVSSGGFKIGGVSITEILIMVLVVKFLPV